VRICTPRLGSPESGGHNLYSLTWRSKFQENKALCSAAVCCNLPKTRQIYTIYSGFVQFRSVGDCFKIMRWPWSCSRLSKEKGASGFLISMLGMLGVGRSECIILPTVTSDNPFSIAIWIRSTAHPSLLISIACKLCHQNYSLLWYDYGVLLLYFIVFGWGLFLH
jgi:hypothetical protein